jgi:hypothetical protein
MEKPLVRYQVMTSTQKDFIFVSNLSILRLFGPLSHPRHPPSAWRILHCGNSSHPEDQKETKGPLSSLSPVFINAPGLEKLTDKTIPRSIYAIL